MTPSEAGQVPPNDSGRQTMSLTPMATTCPRSRIPCYAIPLAVLSLVLARRNEPVMAYAVDWEIDSPVPIDTSKGAIRRIGVDGTVATVGAGVDQSSGPAPLAPRVVLAVSSGESVVEVDRPKNARVIEEDRQR